MFLHERYNRIIVPDNLPGELSLAGKLSLPQTDVARDRVFFSGILSGTDQIACAKDLDYLVIISGPEPQRTILEKIILAKIGELEGSGVALLGSPQEPKAIVRSGNCNLYSLCFYRNKDRVDEPCPVYYMPFGIYDPHGACRIGKKPSAPDTNTRAD